MNTAHFVLGNSMVEPWPDSMHTAVFGLGCFWGAERKFWQLEGVYTTAVGYSGGTKLDPTYREVCSGNTMHAEVVLVVFDSAKISYEKLLQVFWESHDPTQGMRQGNDIGTQYRSAIYFTNEDQQRAAIATRDVFQQRLIDVGIISAHALDKFILAQHPVPMSFMRAQMQCETLLRTAAGNSQFW